jgi:glycine cleavage system transcriptional repressor
LIIVSQAMPPSTSSSQNFLVISVSGPEHPRLVERVSRAVYECGCRLGDSHLTSIGGQVVFLLAAHGEWNNLARLETALKRVETKLGVSVTLRRVGESLPRDNLLPYLVEVVSLDHPGILNQLAAFFAEREIGMLEVATHSYQAAQTGSRMFSVSMTVGIPGDHSIAALRDEFFDRCDQLNVDAIMEPMKG